MLAEKFHDVKFEAGCDEAGRGCLAGTVVTMYKKIGLGSWIDSEE